MKRDKFRRLSNSDKLNADSRDEAERVFIGLEFLRNAQVEEAQKIFEEIIETVPDYAPAHYGLGCVYIRLDWKDRAEVEFKRAIELDPDYGEAHYALAWIKYGAGDLEAGYEHVKKVIESGASVDFVREEFDRLLDTHDATPVEMRESDTSKAGAAVEEKQVVKAGVSFTGRFEIILYRVKSVVLSNSFFSELLINEKLFVLSIFVFSFFVRILYWIIFYPLDFWIDSYHHWQISFFSLKVGFPENGWFSDPGGLVYHWMPLPHVIQMIFLKFNKTLTPIRLFNSVVGSLTVLLVYMIGKKISDRNTATFSAFCLSIFSITIIHDVIGGIEPITTFFLLAAVYVYLEDHYVLSGFLWGMVSLCRTEFWIIGLVVLIIIYLSSDITSFKNIKPLLSFTIVYYFVNYIYGSKGVSFFSLIQNPFLSISSQFFNIIKPNILYQLLTLALAIAFIYLTRKIKNMQVFPILLITLIYSGYMFVQQLRYIQSTKFLLDISNFLLLSQSELNIGPFRYSTIGIPFFFITIPFIILKYNSRKVRIWGPTILVAFVILFSVPVVNLYSQYEEMPLDYMEVADDIGFMYEGENILCDNQIINYQLTASNNIPAKKIRGSWSFKTIEDLEKGNVTLFIMSSITWDGAHALYFKINHTKFNLILEKEVMHIRLPWRSEVIYVYRIEH